MSTPSNESNSAKVEPRSNGGISGVDAVERALTLLNAFNEGPPTQPLKEIAERTGLTKSTILRLAISLERFGYLVRDQDGLFHLGPMLWRLGALFRQNLNLGDVVSPVLKRLVEETNESASFYIPRGHSGVCLYRMNSPRLARDHIDAGDILPFGIGSSGRVLKAFTGGQGDVCKRIRAERVYVSLGERDPDVAGVSAAVLDPDGELVGAVSVSGLLTRFTQDKSDRYRGVILDAAHEIERRMGGESDD